MQWVSWILWPTLLTAAVGLTALSHESGYGTLVFNLTYVGLATSLFCLERAMPYRREWLQSDGQEGADIGHTLITKGFVQGLIHMVALSGVAEATSRMPAGAFWPTDWPLFLQVLLGLALIEFGLYWAHRLAHTTELLWRFHAIHHSVQRLWFWNTGRFHFGDTVVSLALGIPVLVLTGAPSVVIFLTSTTTAYIGILTHCNVRMNCGWISYLFNTPQLHRWHHSVDLKEGNRNFGENLMIFDHLFGTFFLPKAREVERLGIADPMPKSLWAQLLVPFQWRQLMRHEGAQRVVHPPKTAEIR